MRIRALGVMVVSSERKLDLDIRIIIAQPILDGRQLRHIVRMGSHISDDSIVLIVTHQFLHRDIPRLHIMGKMSLDSDLRQQSFHGNIINALATAMLFRAQRSPLYPYTTLLRDLAPF